MNDIRLEPFEERIRLFEVVVNAWFRARKRGEHNIRSLIEIGITELSLTRAEVTTVRNRIRRQIGYKVAMSRSKEMVRFRVLPPAA